MSGGPGIHAELGWTVFDVRPVRGLRSIGRLLEGCLCWRRRAIRGAVSWVAGRERGAEVMEERNGSIARAGGEAATGAGASVRVWSR